MARWARSDRAGFTLIEVMIALALVLALSVLAWASLSPLRDRVAMDEATAMVADGVEQARSMAATSNQVLEVRASIEATTLEIQARAIAPAQKDEDRASMREGGERPWNVLVRIVGSFAREDSLDDGMDEDAARMPMLADGEPEFVSIGMALPDGSMVAGVPLRLKGSDGRWSIVRVGTWTTRVEVEAPADSDALMDGAGDGAGDDFGLDGSEEAGSDGMGAMSDAGHGGESSHDDGE